MFCDKTKDERPNMEELKNQAWIPFAIPCDTIKTRGTYQHGHPEGAIVHFTAGSSWKGSLATLRRSSYPCLIIDRRGNLYQPFPLTDWGYHSGTGHSKTHVGIEVCCAGRLTKLSQTKFKSWFGQIFKRSEVRSVPNKENQQAGYYEKFTQEQESTLLHLLLWLKKNNPEVFKLRNILGHDEVAPQRKNDPGGALSMTMNEYRDFLKYKFEEERKETK